MARVDWAGSKLPSGTRMASERIPRGLAKRTAVPAALRMACGSALAALPSPTMSRRVAARPSGAWRSRVSFGLSLEFSGGEDEVCGFSDGFVGSQEGDFRLRILIFTCRDVGGEDGEEFGLGGGGGGEEEFGFHSCFQYLLNFGRWAYFAYLPLLWAMAARASRSASRRRSVSRLSQSCLPLATASSHLTRPLRK